MKSQIADVLKPILRESVEDRVATALRELIVTGQLAEGTPLVQRDLAERLGVSQTPVRIALGELVNGGLVEVSDTGRAVVSRLTKEDFEEVYALRRGLEGLAARIGAAAVTEVELKRMGEILGELERLARAQDVDGYLSARWEFHATCYRAAGRPRLLADVERLFWRSERYNRLVLSSRARFRASVENYRRFYQACMAGKPNEAARIVEESTQWAVDQVWDSLPSEGE